MIETERPSEGSANLIANGLTLPQINALRLLEVDTDSSSGIMHGIVRESLWRLGLITKINSAGSRFAIRLTDLGQQVRKVIIEKPGLINPEFQSN